MRALAAAAVLLASIPAFAAAPGAFEGASKKAEKLTSLRDFLERYVGSCGAGDKFDKQDCKRNAEENRRKLGGKAYAVTVGDASSAVSLGGCDGAGKCRLHLLPFLDGGGGFALSRGAPKGKDKEGNPSFDLVPVWSDEGGDADEISRAIRTGMVALELVFEPDGVWTMPRPGGSGTMEGVKARWVAVRIRNSRTDDVLAEKKL